MIHIALGVVHQWVAGFAKLGRAQGEMGSPLPFFFSWAGIPIFGAKGDGGTSSHGGMFDVL